MPVQAPINYGLGIAPLNPAQSIMQGMQVGQGLLDSREQGLQRQQAAQMRPLQMEAAQLGLRTGLAAEADANAARALQAAAQQSAAMRAAQKAQAKQELVNSVLTTDKLQKFTILYPEEAKAMEESTKRLSVEERRQFVNVAGQARAALASGSQGAAVDFLLEQSKVRKEAGDLERADALFRFAEQAKQNPTLAQNMLGAFIASDDPEKFAENETKLGLQSSTIREGEAKADTARAEADFKPAMIVAGLELSDANTKRLGQQTAIEWARYGLDKKALQESVNARIAKDKREDVALSEKQQTMLAEAAINASTLGAVATMANNAAKVFEGAAETGGVERVVNTGLTAEGGEAVNRALGRTGSLTEARLAYSQLVDDDIQTRAKESGNKLTDTDYAEQRKLYAPATGAFGPIAKQLRVFESRAKKGSAIDGAKSAWLGANGNLAPASKPFVLDGIVVQRGQTFGDVVKQFDADDAAFAAAPTN